MLNQLHKKLLKKFPEKLAKESLEQLQEKRQKYSEKKFKKIVVSTSGSIIYEVLISFKEMANELPFEFSKKFQMNILSKLPYRFSKQFSKKVKKSDNISKKVLK